MPDTYSSQYREMVLAQVRAGRSVYDLAEGLEVSAATIFRWKRQDQIDAGAAVGLSSEDGAELRAARSRIAELEKELATVKRASELFAPGRVVRPKELFPIVEQLGVEGHGLKSSCRVLKIASSGFFMWRHRPPSARAIRRAWLTDVITQIWEQSRRTYGWRRVQAELADAHDHVANKKLVRAIMRERGISGLPKRRKGRRNMINKATSTDLVNRDFNRDGPNMLWMTDITEHLTREGRVFCCVVLDAWSRKVVGWSIDQRPTTAMVNSALGMAVTARRPAEGTTLHSDHGPQYTAWAFSQKIRAEGLVHSLGTVGDAFDNAMVESFWGRMQTELLDRQKWSTRLELSTAMFDWIEAPQPSSNGGTPTKQQPPESHTTGSRCGGRINWNTKRVPLRVLGQIITDPERIQRCPRRGSSRPHSPTSTRGASNVVDMRAGLVIVFAVALIAGCSGGSSDDAGGATSPINGAEDSSTADPTSQVPDFEPVFAPSDTGSVETDELGGGDDGGGERITFDGVTFEYDPALIDGIVPSRVRDDHLASSDDPSAPFDVRFQFRVGDLETSSLTVMALSDRQGADYAEVTPERLAAALDVKSTLDADADADGVVSFVNGSGIRQVDGDGAYRFVGLTDDRRFLIDVEFDAEAGVDEAVLDDVVRSLFVDVGAEVLNVAACNDDAFFVSDETVPQGAEVEPGAEFVKVWRYRNTGTCVWTEQYALAFGGGTPMTVIDTAPIDVTEPGEELDLIVSLRAPDEPGAYGAQWQLVGPNGLEIVGPPAVLFINVPNIADG